MASTSLSHSIPQMSSPALRGFELNPFRVLRLEVDATTNDATFRAEAALTLAQAGLSPDEPDPLPWMKTANLYELQQAVQVVEEPLIRLKHQLLWFDFAHDPHATLLKQALK